MRLAAPILQPTRPVSRMLDFPELRIGTMVTVPRGTRYDIPCAPNLPTHGTVWITESTPNRIVMDERLRIAGVPMRFTSTLERVDAWHARYTMAPHAFGRTLPGITYLFRIVDAGRGYLILRGADKPNEPASSLRIIDGALVSDVAGPFGIRSPRIEQITQPGEPGYRTPTTPRTL